LHWVGLNGLRNDWNWNGIVECFVAIEMNFRF